MTRKFERSIYGGSDIKKIYLSQRDGMGNCISHCIGQARDVNVIPPISQYPETNLNHTKISTIL